MKIIERLRELEAKATPIWGVPSTVRESDLARGTTHVFHAKTIGEVVVTFADEATARHYIELRHYLPALLAVVEAAEKLNKALCHGFDAMAAGSHEGCVEAERATYTAQRELDAALRAMEGGA